MPAASPEIWRILYAVSRYLFPLLCFGIVLLVLFYILSASRARRESVRSLPGSGTVGELVVLSGGRGLDVNTWFPVPREGVLGAMRSCDLVIPCPGVRSRHLDFSWEDGIGLLIRPCTGCEVLINGMPVTCRTDAVSVPMTHGSVLQVGSAVLRLHLFAALDHTAAPAREIPAAVPAVTGPDPLSAVPPAPSVPLCSEPVSPVPSVSSSPECGSVSSGTAAPDLPRRSGRWKEDLGE